jgi:hypothetical protein
MVERPLPSREEVAARGRAIYEQQIRPRVEPAHVGKFLVIDVDTGDYLMGEDDVALMEQAAAIHPPHSLYGMRIGHRTMGQIGGARTI